MNDKLLKVNELGKEVEMTPEEADQLGAFKETALSEEDAADATEEVAE